MDENVEKLGGLYAAERARAVWDLHKKLKMELP